MAVLTYGHERVLPQVQEAEMGFLPKVYGVTLRDEVHSCEIQKTLNDEPLLRIAISATLVRPYEQNVPGKIGVACPAVCTCGKAVQRSTKKQVE